MNYLMAGLGSALGGTARVGLSALLLDMLGPGFPWGTLAVNVIGSFAIGLYATLTAQGARYQAGVAARHFVMVGLCGGFTTFSLFSLETVQLAERGRPGLAALYVAVSVLFWLPAVWLGWRLAAGINRRGSLARGRRP